MTKKDQQLIWEAYTAPKIPEIGDKYIWERMPVTIIDVEQKHIPSKEYPDGSVSAETTQYVVTLEYRDKDGNTQSLRTPFSPAGFEPLNKEV
jgi:hypothetical protein